MKHRLTKALALLLVFVMMALPLAGCGQTGGQDFSEGVELNTSAPEGEERAIAGDPSDEEAPLADIPDEDGCYTSKEDVADYLICYGRLPGNFITKKEAKKLGWSGGGLEKYAPGMCIGGDRFGNYEGRLPRVKGRTYYECDIDTLGASKRGAKRIVYSDDGQIYYTDDHYESFTLIYGDDE